MNIALFGFKKCGKTYYGLRAAERLHMHFVDTDLLIEEIYEKLHRVRLPYREITKKHGFELFRKLENQAISLVTKEKNSLIALGGGVVLDPENIERLKQTAVLVYIQAPKEVIKHRILSHEPPSYIDPLRPIESFEEWYAKRLPIYEQIPAHRIDTGSATEEEILKQLRQIITEVKNGGQQ